MRAPASIRWFSALAAVVASALLVAPPVSAHSDGPSLRSVAAASTVHARQTSERQVAARMQSSGQPTLAPAPWPWRSVSIDTDDLSTDGVPDNAQIWPWAQTRYDVQTGEATWAVFLYGNPSKNVAYVGYLGHLVGTTCSTRILLVHDDAETGWATSADKFAKTRAATATLHSGGTSAMSWVTMDATTSMRNGSIDCAFARTYSADLGQVYQDTGWMKLNIPKRPKPQLKVTAPTGRLLNPGQRKKITVKVANPTAVPAPSAALRITGGKPSRGRIGLGTIPAHSSRVAHVKVKLRGHHTKVHLSASASGAKTVKRTVLLAAPIRLKKGDSLAGRYFWHTQTSTYEGWDNYGLAFVSSRWAYVGFPQKGLPHCHRQSSVHGDAGCVEYTWNKRTHKLRVGHLRGKFRPGHALVLGGRGWSPLSIPKKGTRIKVSLYREDFYGLYPNETTWTQYLTLDKRGRYTLGETSITSIAGAWSMVSGKHKGHYTIGHRGRITLNPLVGPPTRATIGIGYHKGRPAPRKGGLLIGDLNFYGG